MGTIPNTWGLDLPLLPPGRGNKRRHYWFYSNKPNKGKTTFLEDMQEAYRTSWYSKAESFQSFHADSQFVLIDEMTVPCILATVLNTMCDGNYGYPSKGGVPVVLNKPFILICGNRNPADLYPNAWDYLEARFNVINLDDKEEQEKVLAPPFQKVIKQLPKKIKIPEPADEWPQQLEELALSVSDASVQYNLSDIGVSEES